MAAPNRRRKAAAKRKEEINSKAPRAPRFCREKRQAAASSRLATPEVANPSSPADRKLGGRSARASIARNFGRGRKKKEQKGGRGERRRSARGGDTHPARTAGSIFKVRKLPGPAGEKRSATVCRIYTGCPAPLSRMFFQ